MRQPFFHLTLLLLSVILLPQPYYAQQGSRLGFRAGPLLSWTRTGNLTEGIASGPQGIDQPGFAFDMVYTLGFSDWIMLRTGLGIAHKQPNFVFEGTTFEGDVRMVWNTNLTTLELPVGVKARLPEISPGLHPIVQLGGSAGYVLKNTVSGTYTLTMPNGVQRVETISDEDFSDELWPVVANLETGIGLDWERDWGMLELALTYQAGLTSITKEFNARTQALVLGLGYFF
jgi:Outer membrane protein beta-barrel domain